jgi:hypothetical protein
MDERRKEQRTDVDEVAYIAGDGSSLRCRVVNVSGQGATVELPAQRYMPPQFTLKLERTGTVRHCRLVWTSGNRIGVQFLD